MAFYNRSTGHISAEFIFRTFESCHSLRARKPLLLDALGVSEAQLRDPRRKFDQNAFVRLIQAAEQEIEVGNAYAEIGRKMVPTGFSDTGYDAFFEDDFGNVMERLINAQQLGGGRPPCRMQKSRHSNRLFWDKEAFDAPELINVTFSLLDQTMTHFGGHCCNLVKAIHFSHNKPAYFCSGSNGHAKRPHIPYHFNRSGTFIELCPDVMAKANPQRNQRLQVATRLQRRLLTHEGVPGRPLAKLTYRYLFSRLDKSGLSLGAAAETFGLAERTMRRRLVSEGVSYRQILEQARRDACYLYFLEGKRSLSEIATKLGYSELSAFTRAYNGWRGHPPSRDSGITAAIAA